MSPDPADDPRQRQCGRCRRFFEADHDGPPAAQQDWWVCASCRLTLLPMKAPRAAVPAAPVTGVDR